MMSFCIRSRLRDTSALFLLLGLWLPGYLAHAQIDEQLRTLTRRIESVERQVSAQRELLLWGDEEITKIKLELRLPEALGHPYTGLGPYASHAFSSRAPIRFGLLSEIRWTHPLKNNGLGVYGNTAEIARFLASVSMRFSNRLAASAAFAIQEPDARVISGVRFAHVDYRWDEESGIRIGNFLVPIGVYNLRSDPFLFPTVRPPFVETMIIPAPWNENGILFYLRKGRVVAQAGLVAGFYARWLEGGSWLRGGRQGAIARSESAAGVARLEWMHDENSLGVSAYLGEGHQGDSRYGSARAFLWETHGEFRHGRLRGKFIYTEGTLDDAEKISETTLQTIGNRARGIGAHLSYDVLPRLAPLVRDLIGRPAPPDWKELPVFVSWEYINPQAEVPQRRSADPKTEITAWMLGINYRPHPQVIFKFDHAIEKNGLNETARVYEIGAGFAF